MTPIMTDAYSEKKKPCSFIYFVINFQEIIYFWFIPQLKQ